MLGTGTWFELFVLEYVSCLSIRSPDKRSFGSRPRTEEFRRGGAEEPFAYHPTNYLQPGSH